MRGFVVALHVLAWSSVHQVAGQEYSYTEVNYTITGHIYEFPSDIPEDVTTITINSQLSSSSFPEDAFEKFHQLNTLQLNFNPLTELPNLTPVGATLQSLQLVKCGLTSLNATVYEHLRALVTLNLRGNPLVSFPEVTHGPKATLKILNLQDTRLTSFPAVADYQELYLIVLSGTHITGAVTEADISGPALTKLKLASTEVTSLPEAPKLTESFVELVVKSTNVSVIPLMCPSGSLSVNAELSPVSVCTCENIWLVALHGQRGTVTLDTMDCDGATTTQELLEQRCSTPDSKTQSFQVNLKYTDFFCAFPVHSLTPVLSMMDCFIRCTSTLGCRSFGFRTSASCGVGDCAILAPTDSALTDLPQAHLPGWHYYTLQQE